MEWSTACIDWEKRIVNGDSMLPSPLFPEVADACMAIFLHLRIVDLPGSPTIGQVAKPWMLDYARCIFGSYNEQTGERLIREFFLLISKKNAKSTFTSLIGLTLLIYNWRRESELLIIAPTKNVADNCFGPAAAATRSDEELSDLIHVQDHVRTLTHRVTNAKLRVVAADSNTVAGTKGAFILVEELWAFGKMPNAENMLREATGGLTSRKEGCVIYLTTQSDEPPSGVFKQKLDYARAVRDGEITDKSFLPLIYEFPKPMVEEKAYLKPANFYITNPNIGASVDEAYLTRELAKAEAADAGTLRGFLAKHLNVEIGMSLRMDRWPGADYWQSAGTETGMGLQTLLDRSSVVVVGVDGGGLDDLLGLCVIGRDKDTRKWLLWSYAWAHPSVIERRKDIAPRLHDLAAEGEMTIVEHVGQDSDEMGDMLKLIVDSGKLHQVGIDPNAVGGILDAMLAAGVEESAILNVNQGYRLAGAIKTCERKLATGHLLHNGSAMMRWSVSNAKVKVVGNAIVVTKQVSGSAKIDPVMAMFNAVALMALEPPDVDSAFDINLIAIGG